LPLTFYRRRTTNIEDFVIEVAAAEHERYAEAIVEAIFDAAQKRGTGIARRTPEYIIEKMRQGKAIIATTTDGRFAGFCYIETWEHGRYVANSGLIVVPEFRKHNLARRIKRAAFELSRKKYPDAKIFGITTSSAVMKLNSELGYLPVHFTELTQDEEFWSGCKSCRNFDILQRTDRTMCLCTGMLFDPKPNTENQKPVPPDSTQ
jgi:GNAT superfamily N-acetyltransferase